MPETSARWPASENEKSRNIMLLLPTCSKYDFQAAACLQCPAQSRDLILRKKIHATRSIALCSFRETTVTGAQQFFQDLTNYDPVA